MTKTFCDVCEKELKKDYVSERLSYTDNPAIADMGKGTGIMIEVEVGKNGTWNKGNICLGCLRQMLLFALAREKESS